jgi:hypothetical protein
MTTQNSFRAIGFSIISIMFTKISKTLSTFSMAAVTLAVVSISTPSFAAEPSCLHNARVSWLPSQLLPWIRLKSVPGVEDGVYNCRYSRDIQYLGVEFVCENDLTFIWSVNVGDGEVYSKEGELLVRCHRN